MGMLVMEYLWCGSGVSEVIRVVFLVGIVLGKVGRCVCVRWVDSGLLFIMFVLLCVWVVSYVVMLAGVCCGLIFIMLLVC